MTPPQITAHAEEKYKILKTDCRLTRKLKQMAKQDLINKLMVQHGHKKVNS